MHPKQKKKGGRYKRDIGVYDSNDNLLYIVKNCSSYKEAFKRFEKEYPHPIITEKSARNI